jgi:hypothetical protein
MKSETPLEDPNKVPLLIANDAVPFLKSLNTINGSSLRFLIEQLICLARSATNTTNSIQIQETLLKLMILISINGNSNTAKLLISELCTLPVNSTTSGYQANPQETFLIKLRQEVNPFHENCFSESVKSLIRSFRDSTETSEEILEYFVRNLILVYEWDLQNPNFMAYLNNL